MTNIRDILKNERKILQSNRLLLDIVDEIQNSGVVGEEDTILVLVLKIMLRLVKNANPESSNMIVSDNSGTGKDFIVKKVCEVLLPEKDYIHRVTLTPKVFTYWHTKTKDWTWDGKVLHLEDPNEELLLSDGFKTMASGGGPATTVKKQTAIDYIVNGKPVMIATSVKAKIDIEGVRRWDSVSLDNSLQLTRKVIEKNMQNEEIIINKPLRDALKTLQPREIIIPEQITTKLPLIFQNMVRNRTISKKFKDYIKSSAVLHQHQRKQTENKEIIATWFDYKYAIFVYLRCSTKEGVMLNKIEKEFIEVLNRGEGPMSVSEICDNFSHSNDWIYNNVERLKTLGVIGETHEFYEKANKNIRKFFSVTKDMATGFSAVTDWSQKPPTERFSGFLGFWENVEIIKKKRRENGLSNDIYYIIEKTLKTKNTNNNQQEKLLS